MRLRKTSLPIFLFYMLVANAANAQRFLGIATSEWSAINSVYLNPANIADCREKISISVFSLNFGINNDLGTFSKIGEYSATNSNIFRNLGTKDFSMIIPDFAIHGPGIMFSISKAHSLAITTGFRVINQLNNFDQSLYNVIINNAALSNTNYNISAQKFNWTAHMWSEIGLTYAAVIRDNEKREVKVGITIKRLGGIGYMSVVGNNLDINYDPLSQTFYASHTELDFASNLINNNAAVFRGLNATNLLDRVFGENEGEGLSADMGFTYKLHIGDPDPSDYMESNNTHDLIFSASITDFGAINYANSTNASIGVSGQGNITGQGIKQNVNSVPSFVNYVKEQGFFADTISRSVRVSLPTALLLSADMQLKDRFYANLLYINNLANRQNFGNSYYNQITITPRYDYHKMTIALPITYSMLSKDLKTGVAYRFSGFFIGSDDAMSLLFKYQHGFNLYFGGYIPFYKIHSDPAGIHWSH